MKLNLAIATTAIALAFTTAVNAQDTKSATASAVVISPITLTKDVDMDFGNIAVSASNPGTVVLAPAGTRTRTGGVTLPATTGTPLAAQFTVGGAINYTYAITLPSAATLDGPASSSMTAGTFVSSIGATGNLGAGGTQTFTVGATLTVAAGQTPGAYTTTTPFDVTVNYN
jgi:hypothetical protein